MSISTITVTLLMLITMSFANAEQAYHGNTCEKKFEKCSSLEKKAEEEEAAGMQAATGTGSEVKSKGFFLSLGHRSSATTLHQAKNCYYKYREDAQCHNDAVKKVKELDAKIYGTADAAVKADEFQKATAATDETGTGNAVDDAGTTATDDGTVAQTPTSPDDGEPAATGEKKGPLSFFKNHPMLTGLGVAGAMYWAGSKLMGGDKDKDDEDDEDKVEDPGPLTNLGIPDCAHPEAHKYLWCADKMKLKCEPMLLNPKLSETMSEPIVESCTSFLGAYCDSNPAHAKQGNTEEVTFAGGKRNLELLGVGQGTSTEFCKTADQAKFCYTNAGSEKCPSCYQLAAKISTDCSNDQSKCVASNSPKQMAIDVAKPACVNDPLKKDPTIQAWLNFKPTDGISGDPAIILLQSKGKIMKTAANRQPSTQYAVQDIGSRHGKSASVMASQAIQNLCAKHKWNNCQ